MGWFSTFGKFIFGTLLVASVIGIPYFINSFRRVKDGELGAAYNNGRAEILETGFYFEPSPFYQFDEVESINQDHFTLGPYTFVRVRTGEIGVAYDRGGNLLRLTPGKLHQLEPGSRFVTTQRIDQRVYTLGPYTVVRVNEGEVGVAYDQNGGLMKLESGKTHELGPGCRFDKFVDLNQDVVNMGPETRVIVREGFVGVLFREGKYLSLSPGIYHLNTAKGEQFRGLLSLQQEVEDLPTMTIMTNGSIEIKVDSVLSYRIVDADRAALRVHDLIESIKGLAETTLAHILRQFSIRDISPTPKAKQISDGIQSKEREKTLHEKIHKEFVEKLRTAVEDWGVQIDNLYIKKVMPRDPALKKSIEDIATANAKANAAQQQAQFEKQVIKTQAEARQTETILNAEARKAETVLDAQARNEAMLIDAQGRQQAIVLEAKGKQEAALLEGEGRAKVIERIAAAELRRLQARGEGCQALTTEVAQDVTRTEATGKALNGNVVYLPAPQFGRFQCWGGENGKRNTFFQSHDGHSDGLAAGVKKSVELANIATTQKLGRMMDASQVESS